MTDQTGGLASPVAIDSHHHLWDLSVRDQPWTADLPTLHRTYELQELIPQLASARVGASVLVQSIDVPEETPELLARAMSSAVVAGVVGWTDLTSDDVADNLATLRLLPGGHRLVGIRHGVQSEDDNEWLLRPDVTRGLRAVADAGLVYDLLVTATQLPAAIETVRRLPDVRFVLDHAGKPPIASGNLAAWRSDLAALAEAPNLAVKLSGLFTEAGPHWTVEDVRPAAQYVLDRFGAERTMFGSDWPVCTLQASYAEVMAITRGFVVGLTAAEQAAVFGRTAQRWYSLELA